MFMRDQGAMLEEDYPNVSNSTGTEGTCVFDSSKSIGKVSTWGTITGSRDIPYTKITEVKQKAEQQPLSMSIDASSGAF